MNEHYHSCTTSKKVIGKLYNKNIVIGDENIVSSNEIYAELDNNNELRTLKQNGEELITTLKQPCCIPYALSVNAGKDSHILNTSFLVTKDCDAMQAISDIIKHIQILNGINGLMVGYLYKAESLNLVFANRKTKVYGGAVTLSQYTPGDTICIEIAIDDVATDMEKFIALEYNPNAPVKEISIE